jgi:phage baseplate assembly protein W
MATGISAKLPLRVTAQDGPYELHKDLVSVVKQNFKNLVLTTPGERVMDTNFGVGIYSMLFENYNSDVQTKIRERIVSQTNEYLPFVKIRSVNFDDSTIDTNRIFVAINYFIEPLNFSDELQIDLNGEQI